MFTAFQTWIWGSVSNVTNQAVPLRTTWRRDCGCWSPRTGCVRTWRNVWKTMVMYAGHSATAFLILWKMSHLSDSLMESFWASPLHRDVFPVPGGPEGLWEIWQLYKHGMGSRSMKTEFAKLANKLLLSYHEATRHDSRQLNCCRHFCQRRRLLSKHNPRAGDQSEDKDHVMGCQQVGMGGMKTQW